MTAGSRGVRGALAMVAIVAGCGGAWAERLPLFDAHIHYSRDAWEKLSAEAAADVLRRAGMRGALVSSTPDEGTLRLHGVAPEIVVPELRPYRTGGDMATWHRDESLPGRIEDRLASGIYRGIGEFHLHGEDAASPVVKRVVAIAAARDLVLHAHSDARAVELLFSHHERVRVLWAHAGMSASPQEVASMLERHPRLWAELSIRNGEVAPGGTLDPAWRALFLRFPDRILYGTDTWTPNRWDQVVPLAEGARGWLAQLPPEVARAIAHGNGAALYGR